MTVCGRSGFSIFTSVDGSELGLTLEAAALSSSALLLRSTSAAECSPLSAEDGGCGCGGGGGDVVAEVNCGVAAAVGSSMLPKRRWSEALQEGSSVCLRQYSQNSN